MNRRGIFRTVAIAALAAGALPVVGTGTAQAAPPMAGSGQPTAMMARDVAHPIIAARDLEAPPIGQPSIVPCLSSDGTADPQTPYVFDLRELCGPLRAGTIQPGAGPSQTGLPQAVRRGTVFNEAAPADVRSAEGTRARILPLPITAPSHILPLRVLPDQ